jgi:hypothetical protein
VSNSTTRPDAVQELPEDVAGAWASVLLDLYKREQDGDLASRARGRVHGFEFVRQCRDELVRAGVVEDRIGAEIIVPWLKHVAEWVRCDIDPERISTPPRPDDCLTERQHRMLKQAKKVIAACDPKKPHVSLQRLAGVARDPDGLACRIDDGRVVWEYEPVKLHAADAFAAEGAASAGTSNRGAERREAVASLREHLAGGSVPSNQVIADAKEHGIAERTLRRAFKEMGGRSKKSGDGQWHWGLDSQPGQQDDHQPP